MVAVLEMAKKKKMGRPPRPGAERDDFVRIRMTTDFKAWLQRYADSRQLTITDTLVQAVIEDARGKGFEAPPKR